MDSGVAFAPAVPGLAPRGFYVRDGQGGGVARAISPALQASERQDAEASLHGVSDIEAPGASRGTVTWRTIGNSQAQAGSQAAWIG